MTIWMNGILQHKDVNYQCPEFGAKRTTSCPFVGQEMVVKETMGEQHDTRQVYYLVITNVCHNRYTSLLVLGVKSDDI